jgi:hypothetical protein
MVNSEKIENPYNISTDYKKIVSLALLMMGLY